MIRNLIAGMSVAGITAVASAQLNTVLPTHQSAAAIGDAGNTVSSVTHTGASGIYSRLAFAGNLTEIQLGTFANEAQWAMRNASIGGDNAAFQPSTTGSFVGTLPISRQNRGLFWMNNGDNMRFESFETFDDGAGSDAQWTNPAFLIDIPTTNYCTATIATPFAAGTAFTFDTEGSNFDTENALYTAGGDLLGTDDDSGTGLLSLLNSGVLAPGSYILANGGFDSRFGDGVAIAGAATGNLSIQVNGVTILNNAFGGNGFHNICFDVVPEPTSLALLGLGAAALLRRRA
ncbi:MAG: PEP-CTERM sorting domain-containing protein [Phycisphaerae bacterium]